MGQRSSAGSRPGDRLQGAKRRRWRELFCFRTRWYKRPATTLYKRSTRYPGCSSREALPGLAPSETGNVLMPLWSICTEYGGAASTSIIQC